ncbi:flippase [Turicibacter sanguinis]|uniref:flippase n=1 Tax=Turicibacter sanguinis TaxID=154288 RepID=UPI00164DF260|nr:flippase [Turicibacter sanguinis]
MKKIFKDGALLLIAKLLSMISGMLITIFVARYFGIDVYGKYTTALAFSSFILAFTDLGTDVYLLKECSIDKKKLSILYSNCLILKIFILSLTSIFLFFMAKILNYDSDIYKLILIVTPHLVLNYIINIYFVIMQIEDKLSKNALIQIMQTLIMLFIVLITFVLKLNIFIYGILQIILSLIILITYLTIIDIKFTITLKQSSIIFKGSILFGLSSLLYIVYYKLDTIMLSLIKGSYEVGVYESAYKVISVLISLIVILDNIFMPKFFALFKVNVDKMLNMYQFLLSVGVVISIPICFIIMNLSGIIINLLYGSEYLEANSVFKILIWSVAIRLLAAIVGFVITASNNMKIKVQFQFIFALVNLILNMLLIPLLGAIGGAISTILTELLVLLCYYYFIKKKFRTSLNYKFIFKVILVNIFSIFLFVLINTPYIILNSLLYILYYIIIFIIFNFGNIKSRLNLLRNKI